MNRLLLCVLVVMLLFGVQFFGVQEPPDAIWWPSEWGPDDQRGATNRITRQQTLEAVALIEEGRFYELGRH